MNEKRDEMIFKIIKKLNIEQSQKNLKTKIPLKTSQLKF